MRFLGSKSTQNALAACAPDPADPAGELKRSPSAPPDPLPILGAALQQGKGKGGERGRRERGKGVLGKGKREGREGKGRGE